MAVISRDDGRWVCRYRDENGNKREHSFGRGEDARLQALAYNEDWNNYHQAVRAAKLEQEKIQGTNVMTFIGLVDEVIQHITIGKRSQNHITSVSTVAKAIFIPKIGACTDIRKIDYAKNIMPLMQDLQTEPTPKGRRLTPLTVNKYAHYLKGIFNYAVKRGYIERNPMELWEPLKVVKQTRKLSREDIVKIMAYAAPHVKWAIEVAYQLGVRTGKSELLSLKWVHVDFENRVVHVYAPKTNTYRDVFFSESFCQRLLEMKAASTSEYIVSFNGKQVRDMHKAFRKACNDAGITYPVRMYDIRHRYASELLNNQAPIGVVSKSLGHKRTSTTLDQYYEVLREEGRALPDKLPPLPISSPRDTAAAV